MYDIPDTLPGSLAHVPDSIYRARSTLKSTSQEILPLQMAIQDYDQLGDLSDVQYCREE